MQTATEVTWDRAASDSPMPGVTRRRIVGTHAMLSHFTLQQGVVVPLHQHANEQVACVLSGRIRFTIVDQPDGATRTVTLTGGQALHLPPDVPHAAEALETTIIIDVFSPVSETTGVDRQA